MRELNGRRDMLGELRLLGMAAALAVSGLVVMACGSPAGEAAGPTSTPTPTPTAAMEEQVSAEPTHSPTSTPTAMAQQASAEPTHIPTSTPTPTASGERDSGSDPEATATSTPTPTPTPASSEPEPSSTTTPAVTTTEAVVSSGPPLGDCFGGVLSEHPLHCYVLEQAEARGLMDILGIYDDGDTLYVSTSQDAVSTELIAFAKEQSYAFYYAWPWALGRGDYRPHFHCGSSRPWPACFLDAARVWHWSGGYVILPPRGRFDGPVILVPGGDAGRREISGWASWRQLWPRVTAGSGTATRSTDGGPAFDVSDVDVTNFPEVDCGTEHFSTGCYGWPELQDLGYAGGHDGTGIVAFQMNPPPTDESELKALKDRLVPCHDVIGQCTFTDANGKTWTETKHSTTTIEIIRVKYDFGELWRWATILDRFAVSAGNTIGIVDAKVGWNRSPDLYLNGLSQAKRVRPP